MSAYTYTSNQYATSLKTNSSIISNRGKYNVDLIKCLNSLIYISSFLNKEIEDASYSDNTNLVKIIPILESSGYSTIDIINFLCCKGYVVKTYAQNDPKLTTPLSTYTPTDYSPVITNNDYYLKIDWSNNSNYSSSTYTLTFSVP